MNMTLVRDSHELTCTLGQLWVDGVYECETLEDVTRPEGTKVYGQTAIPYGMYDVVIDYSPRFKVDMPRLLNVPGFEGIRIHTGNTDVDTLGCILVGRARRGEALIDSRVAYNRLFDKLVRARNAGERVVISIERPNPLDVPAHEREAA